jgi:hypothetical protein
MLRPAPATGSTSAPGLSPHRHRDWRTSARGLSPHRHRGWPHSTTAGAGHVHRDMGQRSAAALLRDAATAARANYSLQPDALPVRRARGAPQRYSAAPRRAPPAAPYASVAAAPNTAPLVCVAWRMLQRSRALVACGSATCPDAAPHGASAQTHAAHVRESVRSRVRALAHASLRVRASISVCACVRVTLCVHPFLSSARCWRSPSSALGTRAERCPRGLGWAHSAAWVWVTARRDAASNGRGRERRVGKQARRPRRHGAGPAHGRESYPARNGRARWPAGIPTWRS